MIELLEMIYFIIVLYWFCLYIILDFIYIVKGIVVFICELDYDL